MGIIYTDSKDDSGKITRKYYLVKSLDSNRVHYIDWREEDGKITRKYYVAPDSTKQCLTVVCGVLFGLVMALYACFAIRYSVEKGWI